MTGRKRKPNQANPNPLERGLANISRGPDETDTAVFDKVAVLSMRYAVREVPTTLLPGLEAIFNGRWTFQQQEEHVLGRRALRGEDAEDIRLRDFSQRPRRTVVVESDAVSMLVEHALLGADLVAAINIEEGLTTRNPLMAREGIRYWALLGIIAKSDDEIIGAGTQPIERPDLQNFSNTNRQEPVVD